MNINKFMIGGALAVVALLLAVGVSKAHESAERATISTNDMTLSVRVADSPSERTHGLSGFTAETVKAQGMLFVFPEAEVQDFWMKGMKLDLDVVWIRDGKIVSISKNIPAPKPGEEPARMSSKPIPVDMVLELPAGYVDLFGLTPGLAINIELP